MLRRNVLMHANYYYYSHGMQHKTRPYESKINK
jgi:hypothetical protein